MRVNHTICLRVSNPENHVHEYGRKRVFPVIINESEIA